MSTPDCPEATPRSAEPPVCPEAGECHLLRKQGYRFCSDTFDRNSEIQIMRMSRDVAMRHVAQLDDPGRSLAVVIGSEIRIAPVNSI